MEWLDDEKINTLIERHEEDPRKTYSEYNQKTPNQYLISLINEQDYKRFVKKYCVDTVYKFTTRISFYCLERLRKNGSIIPDRVYRFQQYKIDPLDIVKEMNELEVMLEQERLREKISEETGEIIIQNNEIVGDKYYWFLNDEQMIKVDVEDIIKIINEIYDINGLNEINTWENLPDDAYTEYNELRNSYTRSQNSEIVDLTQLNEYIEHIRENRTQYLSTLSGINTEKLTIYFNENDFIDIDMSTMSAEQFAELLKNAVREGMRESRTQQEQAEEQQAEEQQAEEQPMGMEEFQTAMAQSQVGVAQGIHALAQATAMNKMSDFMNEYRGMTREELINEYEKFGINYVQNSKEEESREDLLRKIDFLKGLKKQSEVLADIKYNKKATVEAGYDRITWDMFEKLSNEKLKSGVPFQTDIKYIQGIPNSIIKYSKDDGRFYVYQNKEKQQYNTYKEAKRYAESGAFYSRELRALRKINNEFENKNKIYDIVFNSRTY